MSIGKSVISELATGLVVPVLMVSIDKETGQFRK
jgi:hypothetical protein